MSATKPIIADPLRLYALGLRNLMDMAILVHVGRCGLIGARRRSIAEHIKVGYDTARTGTDRLAELGLITCISKDQRPGKAHNFVCTVRGWKLLTMPADFSMFPHSQLALKNHACREKSRQETPPENKTPASDAAAMPMGGGGSDDHFANTATDSLAERAAPLECEIDGGEDGKGTGEAADAELAGRP